jgi:hypothetical protein
LARSAAQRIGYHFPNNVDHGLSLRMSTGGAEIIFEAHEFHATGLECAPEAERRACERTSILIRATVTVLGKSVLPGTTIDLSHAGDSITLPYELAQGQKCHIDLQLQACGITGAFHIPAEVRYCVQVGKARFRAGVRFGEIDAATAALIAAVLSIAPSRKTA